MNSSSNTTLLAKIIVSVEKRQAEELSVENANNYLNILFDDKYFYYYVVFGIIFAILFTIFGVLWRICCFGLSTSTPTLPTHDQLTSPPTPLPLPNDVEFFKKRDYGNFDKISAISPDLSINEIQDE